MADLQDVIDKLTNEGELIRNKGAHSIKSVKKLITDSQETPAQRKQNAEDARNAAGKTNTLLESIAKGVSVNSSGVEEAKKSGKLGGLLGGIGASLGGLGIGAGVAMGGLGALFGGARVARAFTPVGAAMTAAGLGKDYYDFAQDEIEKMDAMSDYDRKIYNDMLMDDTNIDF